MWALTFCPSGEPCFVAAKLIYSCCSEKKNVMLELSLAVQLNQGNVRASNTEIKSRISSF